MIDIFNIGWKGNVKARYHSEKLDNKYRVRGQNPIFRAQLETYNYYKNKNQISSQVDSKNDSILKEIAPE